jgi:hypothetical protein
MPPGGGGPGDAERSGLRDVDEEDAEEVTVFDEPAASVMALTAVAPSGREDSRTSTAVPLVMPVRTATPRIAAPS